jgi:probable rRNA maturation factor
LEVETIDVAVNCDLNQYSVDESRIKLLALRVLEYLGKPHHELSIQFSDPERMRELNQNFRNKSTSTDVLSFPQIEFPSPLTVTIESQAKATPEPFDVNGPPQSLGDVVVSLDDADRNALSIGHNLDCEVGFLIVHGILHLCGHDHLDPEEEKLMIREQKKLMGLLNESEDRPLWAKCVGKR